MYYIKEFDPWSSSLCTCPPKYTLNPYTGCSHACVYCYITSYIPNAFNVRIKKDLIKKIRSDIKKIDKKLFISMSNSSDPYPPIERNLGITRQLLKLFMNNNIRYQIVTKSDIVLRDIDIFSKSRCSIAITVTTLKNSLARRLEPNAPPPQNRVKALEELHENNIPITVRIDPIIPFINDDEITSIVDRLSFVDHITTSTFKPRFDSWRRFKKVFPIEAKRLEKIYFENGEKISNSWYLPRDLRYNLLAKVKEKAEMYGITFGSCREGYYSNPTCDGSHLIP